MSLLDNLRKKLKKEKEQPSLRRLLRKQTGCSSRNIYISDRHVDLITDEEFEEYLKVDHCHKVIWSEEIYDCDDIALLFLTLAKGWFRNKGKNAAIGLLWAPLPIGMHAFNFYVRREDTRCLFYDPQKHEQILSHVKPTFILI